jgi:7,8-dihydroneopterin aldolase/epimerase/oxygenase
LDAVGLALRTQGRSAAGILSDAGALWARLPSTEAWGILRRMTRMGWMLADALGIERRPQRPRSAVYRVFVRDLVLPFNIGIYEYEHQAPQRVRINADLLVESMSADDDFRSVLNYETIVEGVRLLSKGEHIDLAETLAERIMDLCLADPRVLAARVSVEKLDVYPEAESVGVVLRRRRPKALVRD